MKRQYHVALVLSLWTHVGCGSNETEKPTVDVDPPITADNPLTSLRWSLNQTTVPVGTSQAIRVEGVYRDGSVSDVTSRAAVSSSDAAVATVADGRVRAVAAGTAELSASLEALSASVSLTVLAAELSAVEVEPSTITLAKGTSSTPRCTGIYSQDIKVDISDDATWALEGEGIEAIAEIDGAKVSALSEGEGTLRCAFEGLSGTASLTVTDAELVTIAIEGATRIPRGARTTLIAVGTFSDESIQLISEDVTWSYTPESADFFTLASGDNNQQFLTGDGTGSLTVTATFGDISQSVDIEFTENLLESLELRVAQPFGGFLPASELSLPAGTTVEIDVRGTYENGVSIDLTTLPNLQFAFEPSGIAEFTSGGRIRALKFGETTMTVSAIGTDIAVTLDITVNFAVRTALNMTISEPQMQLGTTAAFKVTGVYSDGMEADDTPTATWISNAPEVASVSNGFTNSGEVTAKALGSAVITATLGGFTVTQTVEVVAAD